MDGSGAAFGPFPRVPRFCFLGEKILFSVFRSCLATILGLPLVGDRISAYTAFQSALNDPGGGLYPAGFLYLVLLVDADLSLASTLVQELLACFGDGFSTVILAFRFFSSIFSVRSTTASAAFRLISGLALTTLIK